MGDSHNARNSLYTNLNTRAYSTDGAMYWALIQTGFKLQMGMTANRAVVGAGFTGVGLLDVANQLPGVYSENPDCVVVSVGTNSAASVTFQEWKDYLTSYRDLLLANTNASTIVFMPTLPKRSTAPFDPATDQRRKDINDWQQTDEFIISPRIRSFAVPAVIEGVPNVAYFADDLHLNYLGAWVEANEGIIPALASAQPLGDIASVYDGSGFATNPRLAGGAALAPGLSLLTNVGGAIATQSKNGADKQVLSLVSPLLTVTVSRRADYEYVNSALVGVVAGDAVDSVAVYRITADTVGMLIPQTISAVGNGGTGLCQIQSTPSLFTLPEMPMPAGTVLTLRGPVVLVGAGSPNRWTEVCRSEISNSATTCNDNVILEYVNGRKV